MCVCLVGGGDEAGVYMCLCEVLYVSMHSLWGLIVALKNTQL